MDNATLNTVLEIAQRMIEVGAEISRVEDSVTRLCTAYCAQRVDVYATTANIIVTVRTPSDEIITQTRRLKKAGTDIQKLHELNDLVREITRTKPDVPYIEERLSRIDAGAQFSGWVSVLFYGVIAGAFCLFFGGRDWREIMVSVLIGFIVGGVEKGLGHIKANKLLDRYSGSLVACGLAYVALRLGVISSVDNVIIGNIMTLIPGIGLTTSLRDLFVGDIISGALRSIEAVLLALAIALGYITANLLLGGAL